MKDHVSLFEAVHCANHRVRQTDWAQAAFAKQTTPCKAVAGEMSCGMALHRLVDERASKTGSPRVAGQNQGLS